jgi:hypothetical protein
MAYGTDMRKKAKRVTYRVEAGRSVTNSKGKELFLIQKGEEFSPTEADAMTHYVAEKLNKDKDFPKYYKKYMRS